MKIIEEKYNHLTYRTTCLKCGSVLEYGKPDIRGYRVYNYDSSFEYYYIVCPVCGDKIQHTNTNLIKKY